MELGCSHREGEDEGDDATNFTVGLTVVLVAMAGPAQLCQVQGWEGGILCSAPLGNSGKSKVLGLGLGIQI